ncbi:RidA family protein [Propionibacterium freudenreichii]|uniref:RidA family protein n=1 Tax=Propionibacterium freudenreichii TaxID=1744 RepID=UPI00254E25DD|nr:RidA family protein [Propionibacterium freudenreichii]MDK9354569.1 RidA family protein [Propionibacterium freudenreichii]
MTPKMISIGESVASYSHGKVVGNLLFTSGATPHDLDTGEVRGSTIEEQRRLSIQTLEKILTAAGSGLSDLLQVQVFLNDIGADYDGFDATYKQMIPGPFPPRATVGAELPGYRIEMIATAYVSGDES